MSAVSVNLIDENK